MTAVPFRLARAPRRGPASPRALVARALIARLGPEAHVQAVLADAGRRELPEELLQALESAPLVPEHEIDRWIEAHRQMPRTGRDKRPPRSRIKPEDITDQQFRALELAATGLTQKEVALAMGIDRETVRNHISRGCYRLGAKNTTHAVAIAIRKGLI